MSNEQVSKKVRSEITRLKKERLKPANKALEDQSWLDGRISGMWQVLIWLES